MRHIAIAGTVLAIAALSLPGCGRSKHRASVAEARPVVSVAPTPTNYDHYQQAVSAWQLWHATEGCSGPERNAFIAAIGRLKDDSAKWNSTERELSSEGRMAREWHSSMGFAFADESAARGCLTDAERMYRHLLEFYPGKAHVAIQNRAELGLTDVGASQGVAEVVPE